MLKKIAIVGPESSGKTHLCKFLSTHFNTQMVNEYAREFLSARDSHYTEGDLIPIAEGQLNLEKEALSEEENFLFCDTNLLVIKIWSLYKYGRCNQQILDWWNQSYYDLHLLLQADIAYETDSLRENPDIAERKEIFSLYEQELKLKNANYIIIEGQESARIEAALFAISQHFFL